jgi:hypothetical protein
VNIYLCIRVLVILHNELLHKYEFGQPHWEELTTAHRGGGAATTVPEQPHGLRPTDSADWPKWPCWPTRRGAACARCGHHDRERSGVTQWRDLVGGLGVAVAVA